MTRRSIKEIEEDIINTENESRKLHKWAWLAKERKFRAGTVDDLNKLNARIRNLKNELNQAKMRDFGSKEMM